MDQKQPAQKPANTIDTLMARSGNMREGNLYKFVRDLKDAGQIDLDEFNQPKITDYTSISGGWDLRFIRNGKNAKANIRNARLSLSEDPAYVITFKSWDPDNADAPLDSPSDGWSGVGPAKPGEEPKERAKRTVDGPIMTFEGGIRENFLRAAMEIIHGKE